jgi:hypothetical protein
MLKQSLLQPITVLGEVHLCAVRLIFIPARRDGSYLKIKKLLFARFINCESCTLDFWRKLLHFIIIYLFINVNKVDILVIMFIIAATIFIIITSLSSWSSMITIKNKLVIWNYNN